MPLVLFFDLTAVTTVAALAVLVVQGLTHVGHLMRLKETGANPVLVALAALAMFAISGMTLVYTSRHEPMIGYYLFGAFSLAFLVEIGLRLATKRIVSRQIVDLFNLKRWEEEKRI